MRKFHSWEEAAKLLGTDGEGLRQGLLLGLSHDLRAYVDSGERPFVGRLDGPGILRLVDEEGTRRSACSRHDSDEPTLLADGRTLDAWQGSDTYGSWEKQDSSRDITGWPAVYYLHGWLRVMPETIIRSTALGRLDGVIVTPQSWWGPDSPVPREDDGEPSVYFFVLDRGEKIGFRSTPKSLEDLWFAAEDVEQLRGAGAHASTDAISSSRTAPQRLRSHREKNLLRVIAGLWELSGLPKAHNTTADKLSALFDIWGWDGPAKSTIADTILKEAAGLPRGTKS